MLQPPTTSPPPGSDAPPPPLQPLLTTNNSSSAPRRRIPRRATINETPSLPTRRSSLSVRDATTAIRSTVTSDNPEETWHSVPLAFAVLPALGGLLFTNGSLFITDILLLFFVAVFLHWLIKFPWEWYHSSQAMKPDRDVFSGLSGEPSPSTTSSRDSESCSSLHGHEDKQKSKASRELARNEKIALICCFIGPCLGGWLLHTIRSQLSRPSEGLISNFNVTIFVLAAELRPTAHVVKLMRCRNIYLQGTVHQPPRSRVEDLESKVQELSAEVKELSMLTARAVERDPDLDALNRAVRRYEKKEALHSAQTQTRIMEIDNRLNDVLTLAAAASVRQQHDSLSAILLKWIWAVIVAPFSIMWRVVSLPARAVETIVGMTTGRLIMNERQRQRRGGQGRVKGIKVGNG